MPFFVNDQTPELIRLALARCTFPTKQETAQHYPVHFEVCLGGIPHWRVFNPDCPDHVRQALLAKLRAHLSAS